MIYSHAQAKLTEEQVAKLKEHREVCIKETGAGVEKIDAAKKGEFADDAKLKAYLLCIAKRIGFIDGAGELQSGVLKAKVGAAIDDQELADKLEPECAVKKDSPEETVFQMAKCFYEKNPKHVVIL